MGDTIFKEFVNFLKVKILIILPNFEKLPLKINLFYKRN